MKYDLVIFDLDGTLLNTLDDLTSACNHALAGFGFPTRTPEQVRLSVGNGAARLMRRSAPEGTPEDALDRLLTDFKAYYAQHVNEATRPYPGIPELIAALNARGLRVAVNSNKPDAATQALCDAHFGGALAMALGEKGDIPKKPAPDGARRIMDALGVAPARTLYVGDGDTDLMTARNAGIDAAWVSWGFRKREELGDLPVPHAFDTAQALCDFILGDA